MAVVFGLVGAIGLGHWLVPTSFSGAHIVHVSLRKLFVLPIVLSVIWFGLIGSLASCLVVSVIYAPHIFVQWFGYTSENINQVGEIASMWVLAVVAGMLASRERKALREVAWTHEGSLMALVAALDVREHETELHSLRVRAYALRIAEEMKMPSDKRRTLGQAALLHDIGKLGVPDRVLLKPARLTSEEWASMRRHPEIGRGILSAVPFLRTIAEIVYCHHERWDGSGYPRGLTATQIPASAEVFAVADAFDAMTSQRPYKSGMSFEQARVEIMDCSGSQFAPEVVEAFLKISLEEWKRIRDEIERDGMTQSAEAVPGIVAPRGASRGRSARRFIDVIAHPSHPPFVEKGSPRPGRTKVKP